MDALLQRTLKIGRATVGLLGVDIALRRALAAREKPEEEVLTGLYAEVARHNYIPPGKEELYREALTREYERQLAGETGGGEGHLEIRILGPGCVSCNNLQKMVIEIMSEQQLAADVFQVHDPDEIGRFGILRTPALVVNGEVRCAGRLPSKAQVEEWLREAADS